LTASLLLTGARTIVALAACTAAAVVVCVGSLAALPLLIAEPFAILKPSAPQR
jgi:hypothetical protein